MGFRTTLCAVVLALGASLFAGNAKGQDYMTVGTVKNLLGQDSHDDMVVVHTEAGPCTTFTRNGAFLWPPIVPHINPGDDPYIPANKISNLQNMENIMKSLSSDKKTEILINDKYLVNTMDWKKTIGMLTAAGIVTLKGLLLPQDAEAQISVYVENLNGQPVDSAWVTSAIGSGYTQNGWIEFEEPTGIEETETTLDYITGNKLEIYDIGGRLVTRQDINGAVNWRANVAAGVYFARITGTDPITKQTVQKVDKIPILKHGRNIHFRAGKGYLGTQIPITRTTNPVTAGRPTITPNSPRDLEDMLNPRDPGEIDTLDVDILHGNKMLKSDLITDPDIINEYVTATDEFSDSDYDSFLILQLQWLAGYNSRYILELQHPDILVDTVTFDQVRLDSLDQGMIGVDSLGFHSMATSPTESYFDPSKYFHGSILNIPSDTNIVLIYRDPDLPFPGVNLVWGDGYRTIATEIILMGGSGLISTLSEEWLDGLCVQEQEADVDALSINDPTDPATRMTEWDKLRMRLVNAHKIGTHFSYDNNLGLYIADETVANGGRLFSRDSETGLYLPNTLKKQNIEFEEYNLGDIMKTMADKNPNIEFRWADKEKGLWVTYDVGMPEYHLEIGKALFIDKDKEKAETLINQYLRN
jgi:hypothetical protein